MQEQFSATHPWRYTGIVPDDSQHTTYMDVGSAENAGAILCHPSLEIYWNRSGRFSAYTPSLEIKND
jgi:hypothetical protein